MAALLDPSHLARLPAAEAIAYMAGRDKSVPTYYYSDLWHEAHAQAFTISRLVRADLLEAFRKSIAKSVDGDLSRRDWMRDAEALLTDAGWWGVKEVVEPNTGEILRTRFDHPRLALIFDTNLRQAHAAGQWQRLQRNKDVTPYVRYVSMDDGRVRPLHRLWHNTVLPVDDEWVRAHWPPNGWRCRCRMVGVTRAEYERGYVQSRPGAAQGNRELVRQDFKKLHPPEPPPRLWRNPGTGKEQLIPAGIDPGFDYNPGATDAQRSARLSALIDDKLARLDTRIAAAARDAQLRMPQK